MVGSFWLVKNLWFFCASKLIENLKLFCKSNRSRFLLVYRRDITHAGCWENMRKACNSQAEGKWFTSFSSVLPTSQLGYHAGKPIENCLVYCLSNATAACKLVIFYQFGFIRPGLDWASMMLQGRDTWKSR